MPFDPSFLDEIRARLPVSQVVARRVKLKRQGREFVGLSPFKQEKTPSFTVNDAKGFYHCFASGEHGDIFTFVMKTEGLAFPEAVARLAEEAGLPLPKMAPQQEEQAERIGRLQQALEATASFYQNELAGPRGGPARRYLDERGVEESTREAFRIGFAPADRHALKSHLAGKGFTQEEMVAAGLLIAGEDIPVSFDRFRNRIMFPIGDARDRPIAFGGRALDPSQPAKYLNSPETALFHKGHVLFNAARARAAARERAAVLVVEGYMDVVALVQAGFAHVVAPLGTALSEAQLRLLWRMAPEPMLCFDGDEAGERAAFRAVDTALPHLAPGMSLAFAFLPTGCDPDDLVRSEGAAALQAVLDRAVPLADMVWLRETAGASFETPERRAALEHRLAGLLDRIADQAVRRHYGRHLADRLRRLWSAGEGPPAPAAARRHRAAPFERPRRPFPRGRRRAGSAPAWSDDLPASDSLKRSLLVRSGSAGCTPREALLVLTVLNHPWLLDAYAEEWAAVPLASRPLAQLREAVLQAHALHAPLDSEALHTQLRENGLAAIVARAQDAITHRSDAFMLPGAARRDVEAGWRQVLVLHRKSKELERELEAAERAFRAEESDTAFERLCDIRRQLDAVEGMEAGAEG